MEGAKCFEEYALAENATGHLGAILWSPRTYICNFCGREFGSAQALGGHMNVHRRDRARLKLCSESEKEYENHRKIVRSKFPYALVYSSNGDNANTARAFGSPVPVLGLQEQSCKNPEIFVSDVKKENVRGKRWRNDELSLPSFSLLPKSKPKKHHLEEDVEKQDMDLELRLGFSLF